MKSKTNPNRTLFHAFPGFEIGGAQVRFATLANKHQAQFTHLIYAMNQGYSASALLDADVDYSTPAITYEKGRIARNFMNFRAALKRLHPDVLVTYNWGSIEWALANIGRPLRHIHIVDGFGPEEADRQLARRVYFRRILFMRNTTIVVPSQTLYEIATEVWRMSPKKVSFIPNGIDCERFKLPRNQAIADQYGIKPGTTVVGTVATLRPEKNIQRLLLSFQQLLKDTKARLIIVGDGPERAALEAFAKQIDIANHVVFAGYIADPAAILGQLDIFALSSDTEQMPISVLEAMASGLPIAGVDVGDVRHIVSDANKPHIVTRDVDDLASVLSAFAADPTLRQRVGEQNRVHVKTAYDEGTMVDAYARLFSA